MLKISLCILLALSASAAQAQSYPARPVRVLVGFPPGGGTDILARVLTPKLSEYLGQQFVVENRPGASGNLGADVVAKSAPDGYTMGLITASTHGVTPALECATSRFGLSANTDTGAKSRIASNGRFL